MRNTLLAVAVSMLASTSLALAAGAERHDLGNHLRHHGMGFAPMQAPGSFDPPRMIETSPGHWVSTYDLCGDPCDSH
jgi:hypothetical protein